MNIPAGTRDRLRELGEPSEDVASWVEAELERRQLARELADLQRELDVTRRELARLAAADPQTGLLTGGRLATSIEQSFARTQRQGSLLAVLLVELDVADGTDDEADRLVALADVLRWVLRAGDLAGRVDDRRFVVVAEPVDGCEGAIAVASRILDASRRPRPVGEVAVDLRVRIGGCVSGGRSTPAVAVERAGAMLERVRGGREGGLLITPLD